ncbi:hypothetical protein [Leucobacter coleopterorum]|uniref:hypothetical protein n=1 Tax=Leucobacter coleopterorum TaxID=2714933 RepID=UPI001FCC07B0|nr:hypothetical protein [Leucobacter coleopterorum]
MRTQYVMLWPAASEGVSVGDAPQVPLAAPPGTVAPETHSDVFDTAQTEIGSCAPSVSPDVIWTFATPAI